jgi:hypothetical protein
MLVDGIEKDGSEVQQLRLYNFLARPVLRFPIGQPQMVMTFTSTLDLKIVTKAMRMYSGMHRT